VAATTLITRPRPRRPFGVWVLAILSIVNGSAVLLVSTLYVLGLASQLDTMFLSEFGVGLGAGLLSIISMGLAASTLVAAIGLLLLQRWAWIVIMLATGLGLAIDLYLYFNGSAEFWSMTLNVAVVLYLNQRDVQAVFLEQRS
jgi:uncharacterized membrane protein (DUF2068 family)